MTAKLRSKSSELAVSLTGWIAVAVAAIVGFGCAQKEQVKSRPMPPPAEPIPMESQAYVRTGEIVKAYPVGRYVDPANRDVMHERHVVYRVERDNSWKLTPPNNRYDMTLLGPVAGVRGPYYKDSPIPAQLSRELQKQREITRSMSVQAERSSEESRRAVEQAQQAALRISEQESKIAAAKADADAAKAEVAELRQRLDETSAQVDEIEVKEETIKEPQPTPEVVEEEWMRVQE